MTAQNTQFETIDLTDDVLEKICGGFDEVEPEPGEPYLIDRFTDPRYAIPRIQGMR
ncbi:hypothetical protein SynBIOSE41_02486 [Synechococcus sp. BIOS-E4-1]|nr:hypothetical protein SynBIOSE41_02486 [Synechococcus sp. BIOS-E4-1]